VYRLIPLGIAVLALWLQMEAYDASWLRATEPTHCQVWGFGSCSSVMASGWAHLLNSWGATLNLEAAMARGVPLIMWWAALFASFGPRRALVVDEETGKRRPHPNLFLWLAALAFILLLSAWVLQSKPLAVPVSAPM